MKTTTKHRGFLRRVTALLRKEVRQMLRDRSNLAVGLLLSVVLILLFGYGLSFDVKNAPVALVLEDPSPMAQELAAVLQATPYLAPVWVASMPQAEVLIRTGQVDAILRVPRQFSRRVQAGDGQIQLLLNGVDSSSALTIESYISGTLAVWAQQQADRAGSRFRGEGQVELVQRMWFNEAGESRWFLIPGLIVLVLTLIGGFLTSLLIAREWERGTLESLFVTPVRPFEIVLSKITPYWLLGMLDLLMCLATAHYLFQVPMRGSLMVIVVTGQLYLLVSLLLGLFISGVTRNQFQASQLALLLSFMPAMMLSGFVFDLRNLPLIVRVISQLLPATYFMELIKTLFMAGNNWPMIVRNGAILMLYALVLMLATRHTLRKRLR